MPGRTLNLFATRKAAIRSMAVGCLTLFASLGLYVLYGLFLMDYDDRGYGEWTWALANEWLALLPPGLRSLFWITAVASPVTRAVGAILVAGGLFHLVSKRGSG